MRAIQREVGEDENSNAQLARQLRNRLQEAEPPEHVMQEAERDLNRLEAIPPARPEYPQLVTYLELLGAAFGRETVRAWGGTAAPQA
jgi:ATP-dependent Lon protease